MRSRLRALRFSPDGNHVLLQDETAIYILTRQPLAVRFRLLSSDALAARFSADSQTLIVATRDMDVGRWSLNDGRQLDAKSVGSGNTCYAATLSEDGEFYACLDARTDLRIFSTTSGEKLFESETGVARDPGWLAVVPYHYGLAHSEPFGYFLTNSPPPPRGVAAATWDLQFSPDRHFLIGHSRLNEFAVFDLQKGEKFSLSGSLRHAAEHGSIAFVGPDRVVSITPEKKAESNLLTFPSGEAIGHLDIAGTVLPTSNPRYLISQAANAKDTKLVDMQTGKTVAVLPRSGGDVLGNEIVSYTDDGILSFTHIGEERPAVQVRGPLSPLPPLRVAAVSPGLVALAIGVAGHGAVFRTSSGERVAGFDQLQGAWFPDDKTCLFQIPGTRPQTSEVESLDLPSAVTSSAWSRDDLPIHSENIFSGGTVLSYVAREIVIRIDQRGFPFELEALDSLRGKHLWLREFGGNPYRLGEGRDSPVPFTDPQGDRVVLGWHGKSQPLSEAIEHSPIVRAQMKRARVSNLDSIFEVLDGRTGKTLGAGFVQTGTGPESFDSAFSEGDWLILARDGRRVIIVSLSSGKKSVLDDAYNPAISTQGDLLAYATHDARLVVYDLRASARHDEYTFPEAVVYSHFSSDGKRLLVLTQDQTVYVLDVTNTASAPPR
jgi:WD40 repeat protein